MRTLLLFPLSLTIAGCTANPSKDSATASETGSPDDCPIASASPTSLTWASLTFGVAGEEVVSVSNDCSGDASLTISASIDNAGFSVAPADLSVIPGDIGLLVVTATVADYEPMLGTLSLETDDPASPTLTIALSAVAGADQDGDGYSHDDDCDDLDGAVYPGAPDAWYDGLDRDCAGNDDQDQDGDGWPLESDCDDTDPSRNPDAVDTCNGVDEDCDGVVDGDADGDGYTVCDDCDDTTGTISPGAEETCEDSLDQDCDGADDECRPIGTYYLSRGSAKVIGANTRDQAGSALSAADIDADGYADVLVGAYLNDDAAVDTGAAYLVRGPVSATVSLDDADATWTGGATEDHAGRDLAIVGDIDRDGLQDLMVGANLASSLGAAYLLYWGSTGSGSLTGADVTFIGDQSSDTNGFSVAGAGDANGDGWADILVGASYNHDADTGAGAAFLVYGPLANGTLDLADADAELTGEAHGDEAGRAVAGAGDIDGDGFDDLLIGAPAEDGGATDAGAAYLVLGPPTEGVSSLAGADAKLIGTGDSGQVGQAGSLLRAGDLNDDGFDDVLVSSADEGPGEAYVMHGPFSGDIDLNTADLVFTGEDDGDNAGFAPAAGDVDGDGWIDLLIGAPAASSGGVDYRGKSYLVYGPFTGSYDLAVADITFVGEDEGDYAGFTNALADVDGDGFADILIGIYADNDGGDYAGAVSIYYAADL